ncbi:hypothetical protein BGZ97_010370, partial [Linnemannia gamsii]
FPALKSFYVTLPPRVYGNVSHGDEEDTAEESLPVDGPPKMYPERYRLRRFCVSGAATTTLWVLKRLIVTCPDLRVFNVKGISITLSSEEDQSDEGEAIREVEEHTARQGLIDLAAKHCPDLEWYSFHRHGRDTDEKHLGHVARTLPDQSKQSMTFVGTTFDKFDALAFRDFLSKLTVLEIESSRYEPMTSDTLNKILCLTPNLMHLDGPQAYLDTKSLWTPPEPVKPKRVFATAGDRKRYERKERRRSRQQATSHYRSRAPAVANGTPTIDPSTPVIWNVYRLKTLNMNLTPESSV